MAPGIGVRHPFDRKIRLNFRLREVLQFSELCIILLTLITHLRHVSCREGGMMSNTGIKMTRKLAWAAAAILALAPLEAEAATLAFSFETQDGVFSGSGDLMVSDTLDSAGGYDVTGLSGTLSGPGGGAMTLVAKIRSSRPPAPTAPARGTTITWCPLPRPGSTFRACCSKPGATNTTSLPAHRITSCRRAIRREVTIPVRSSTG